jgi:hypothetical protein
MGKIVFLFPKSFRLVRLYTFSSCFSHQKTTGCQGIIPDHFSRKPVTRTSGQPLIIRIFCLHVLIRRRTLTVSGRHDHELEQFLYIPTGILKGNGQPV